MAKVSKPKAPKKMVKAVKPNEVTKSAPTTETREINTNPFAPINAQKEYEVLADLSHFNYACEIGKKYPFPAHVASVLLENRLIK